MVDPETNALWYLETDTWRSTWGRPEDVEAALKRRERILKAQRKREYDELLVGEPDDEWVGAFQMDKKKVVDEEEDVEASARKSK